MSDVAYAVTADGHFDVLRKFCRSDLRQRNLTDITVEVSGHKVAAHRLILAAHSQYFNTIFNSSGTCKSFW